VEFALTEEQLALQDTVRSFLADRFDLAAVRRVYDDPDGDGNPQEVWKAAVEQGWLAVTVPEQHDGLGLGLLDASVIIRCLGAGAVPTAYPSALLAIEGIRLAGSSEQQAQLLPRLAAGEARFTTALYRAGGAWDATGAPFTADGDALTGTASGVEYAVGADGFVVATTDGDLWLVEGNATGLTITPGAALDRTTRLAEVTLAGTPGQRLTGMPGALPALLAAGATLASADLTGIAREALTRTVQYDIDRVQFGKPVGSFQAIKHALADLAVAVTMTEHASLYAAYALDSDAPDAALAVSVAKAKSADTARAMTAAMIQYHGGIGYTWEHDTHFYFKRAHRLAAAFGDATEHREVIAHLVIDA
jgi:alkylation response protein AidB-like acyl-CoA dehydrogenase